MTESTPQTETASRARNGYLHVLPEGWTYRVTAEGPDGSTADIDAGEHGEYIVRFATPNERRRQAAPSLADACKALAQGVKLLDQIAQGEAAVRRARDEALSALGPSVDLGPQNGGDSLAQPAPSIPRSTAPSDS